MLEGGKKYKWIRGAPPLSFKALAAGELENYRIYGNTVGGAGVGDLVESGEHAGEYKIPVTVSNGTDTLTTPIYLPEQIRKVGDEAEYIDYAEQKQHRVRKNLLQNTVTSQTVNGVTYTVNDDGSVTCNGNASSLSVFKIPIYLYDSTSYILNGCPLGGSSESYGADLRHSDVTVSLRDYGAGINYTCTKTGTYVYAVRIAPGYTCDNLTFYPMIRRADITDAKYEPYIEDTELDVTLPALPTIKGTNMLSVGTEVQPSEIEVKGKIKAL